MVPGSASDRSRHLHIGDRLLSVNGVNVTGLPRDEVIRLVKASGSQLALVVLHNARKCRIGLKVMLSVESEIDLQRLCCVFAH